MNTHQEMVTLLVPRNWTMIRLYSGNLNFITHRVHSGPAQDSRWMRIGPHSCPLPYGRLIINGQESIFELEIVL